MTTLAAPARAVPWRADATIIGVVAFAHLVSHFCQMLLPPLFPWLRSTFDLSYAELGFVLSVLFVVSGTGQAAAGFVVDRFGAGITLIGGLLALAGGALVAASAGGYAGLLGAAVLLGIGNAVFHPVDYWLINHRVSVPRLGPAYSAHGVSGSIGWALAPLFMTALAGRHGWRFALAAAALLPLAAILLAWSSRALRPAAAAPGEEAVAATPTPVLGFLRLPAVWLCFAFFACVAAALGGVQGFAATLFGQAYGLPVAAAALSVSLYMLGSAAGMLAGGWLVVRSQVLERNITLALMVAVTAALLVASGAAPAAVALGLMVLMGFGSGLSGPSRDLLIRAATPAGATGRVYGVVYSGLDVGIALGPLAFGYLLDHGAGGAVWYAIAACLAGGLVLARMVALRVDAAVPAGHSTP